MSPKKYILLIFGVFILGLVLIIITNKITNQNQNYDPRNQAASPEVTIPVKVLTLYYYNSGNNPDIVNLNEQVATTLTNGSEYHGYKNSTTPYLNYSIENEINFDKPVPPSEQFLSNNGPFADHFKILEQDTDVCNYVDNLGINEVWIWMEHVPGTIVPIESNMSMGRNIQAHWNYADYGDISNGYRHNDLPICDKTYTVYNYNLSRDLGLAVENHTHQIEHVLNWIDGRDSTPHDQWGSLLFWGKFVGSDMSHQILNPGCGWTHYPPNGDHDYDWYNTTPVLSDCEDWKPDGTGEKTIVSCETWTCEDDGGVAFKIWWMQNIPGANNNLEYDGHLLNNWWDFIGKFDSMMLANNTSLVSSQSNVNADYQINAHINFHYEGIPIISEIKDLQGNLLVGRNMTYDTTTKIASLDISTEDITPGNYQITITPRYYTSLIQPITIPEEAGTIMLNYEENFLGGSYSQNAGNTQVGINDLSLAVSYFKSNNASKDLNGDIKYNVTDLAIVVRSFKLSRGS